MAWEEKPRADNTWVHLRTYFKDRWTATMRYQGNNPLEHGFERAAITEEYRGDLKSKTEPTISQSVPFAPFVRM